MAWGEMFKSFTEFCSKCPLSALPLYRISKHWLTLPRLSFGFRFQEEARVLDLFAGSGIVGLESVSRGAGAEAHPGIAVGREAPANAWSSVGRRFGDGALDFNCLVDTVWEFFSELDPHKDNTFCRGVNSNQVSVLGMAFSSIVVWIFLWLVGCCKKTRVFVGTMPGVGKLSFPRNFGVGLANPSFESGRITISRSGLCTMGICQLK